MFARSLINMALHCALYMANLYEGNVGMQEPLLPRTSRKTRPFEGTHIESVYIKIIMIKVSSHYFIGIKLSEFNIHKYQEYILK